MLSNAPIVKDFTSDEVQAYVKYERFTPDELRAYILRICSPLPSFTFTPAKLQRGPESIGHFHT